MKKDFLEQEEEREVNNIVCQDRQLVKIRFNPTEETNFKPYTDGEKNLIYLPLQNSLILQPQELCLVDLKIQLLIPENLYGVIRQAIPNDILTLYTHTGLNPENETTSFNIYAKNVSNKTVQNSAGEPLVTIALCSNSNCIWEGEEKRDKSPSIKKTIGILHEEQSLLHTFIENTNPAELNLINIPNFKIPEDVYSRQSIMQSIRNLDESQAHDIINNCAIPIRGESMDRKTEICDFTKKIAQEKIKLQNISVVPATKLEQLSKEQIDSLKESLHFDMCQKLAVLGIDLLRNQAITRDIFARAQQSDDYFSVIYQSIREGMHEFPNYIVKDSVLYKKIYDKQFRSTKFVICLPDILLPSVIHTLHVTLGHPSKTATVKNFQTYYYHPKASNMCREYVKSCLTCTFAGKYDLKKVITSTKRTLKPTRPRQHLYCDLIPMPKTEFSYILFGLDA